MGRWVWGDGWEMGTFFNNLIDIMFDHRRGEMREMGTLFNNLIATEG